MDKGHEVELSPLSGCQPSFYHVFGKILECVWHWPAFGYGPRFWSQRRRLVFFPHQQAYRHVMGAPSCKCNADTDQDHHVSEWPEYLNGRQQTLQNLSV